MFLVLHLQFVFGQSYMLSWKNLILKLIINHHGNEIFALSRHVYSIITSSFSDIIQSYLIKNTSKTIYFAHHQNKKGIFHFHSFIGWMLVVEIERLRMLVRYYSFFERCVPSRIHRKINQQPSCILWCHYVAQLYTSSGF